MSTYTPELPEIISFLRHASFFKDLKESELKVIGGVTRVLSFEEGANIVRQGERANEFFILAEGRAQVLLEDPALGVEQPLLELGAYDSFGELSLLNQGPRTATVRALTKTLCVVLSGPDFEGILETMPQAAIPLSRHLASRLTSQGGILTRPVQLKPEMFDRDVYGMLSPSLAERLMAIPLHLEADTLVVAMTNPQDPGALDELRRAVPGLRIKPLACDPEDYKRFLREVVRGAPAQQRTLKDHKIRLHQSVPELEELLTQALKQQASEIRLGEDRCRLRCQGVLQDGPDIVQRAKIYTQARQLCGLKTDHPSPWHGSACLEGEPLYDARFSSVPTNRGEKLVIRLLPADRSATPLDELIPSASITTALRAALRRPGGMVLVCGPARSGKTATLYAALRDLHQVSPELSLVTVEDEVEWTLEGITQCPGRGPELLGAALRLEPDLLMVGELRDPHLALEAALTRSVMAGMFALDTTDALEKLTYMGCPPWLVTSAVELVLGQMLVRAVCPGCREEYAPPEAVRQQLGEGPFFRGKGCERCRQTGYDGMVPALERLHINEAVREALARDPRTVRQQAKASGALTPFRQSVQALLKAGRTSPSEALRLFGGE